MLKRPRVSGRKEMLFDAVGMIGSQRIWALLAQSLAIETKQPLLSPTETSCPPLDVTEKGAPPRNVALRGELGQTALVSHSFRKR